MFANNYKGPVPVNQHFCTRLLQTEWAEKRPNQVYQYTEGYTWSLFTGVQDTTIFYCPYCGDKLPLYEMETAKSVVIVKNGDCIDERDCFNTQDTSQADRLKGKLAGINGRHPK